MCRLGQAGRESFGNAVQKTDSGSNRQEGCCHGGRGVRVRVAAKRGRLRKRKEGRKAEHHALKRLEAVLARVVVEVDYAPC